MDSGASCPARAVRAALLARGPDAVVRGARVAGHGAPGSPRQGQRDGRAARAFGRERGEPPGGERPRPRVRAVDPPRGPAAVHRFGPAPHSRHRRARRLRRPGRHLHDRPRRGADARHRPECARRAAAWRAARLGADRRHLRVRAAPAAGRGPGGGRRLRLVARGAAPPGLAVPRDLRPDLRLFHRSRAPAFDPRQPAAAAPARAGRPRRSRRAPRGSSRRPLPSRPARWDLP